MRRASDARVLLLVLAAWLLPIGFARSEVDAARVAELKTRMLARKATYQFELPSGESMPGETHGLRASKSQKAGKLRGKQHLIATGTPPYRIWEPLLPSPPRSISDLLELLLWVAVVAGAALGGVYLAVTYTDLPRFVIAFTRRRSPRTDQASASASSRVPRRADPIWSTLSHADELAKQEKFGEALHVLLKVVLFELARRRDGRIPPGLTAREVVVSDIVPLGANASLYRLVGSVELCIFGGRPANSDVFADARVLCSGVLTQLGVHHE